MVSGNDKQIPKIKKAKKKRKKKRRDKSKIGALDHHQIGSYGASNTSSTYAYQALKSSLMILNLAYLPLSTSLIVELGTTGLEHCTSLKKIETHIRSCSLFTWY